MTAIYSTTHLDSKQVAIELVPNERLMHRTPLALNALPAAFVLTMLFVATILAIVASAPIIAFLSGISSAIIALVFTFADLHIRTQKAF